MSTATRTQPRATASSLRRMVAGYPVTAFLVMAYAIGWTIFSPVVLSEQGLGLLPIHLPLTTFTSIASILALALPAFLVTAATGGKGGVQDLLNRCLRWRVRFRWYLIALLGLLVATLLVTSVFLGFSPLETFARKWSLFFSVFLPEVLVPFVFIQMFEETGWTGFLQSTLQERHGPLLASIMVAPAFALMHLPLLLLNVPRDGFTSFILGVAVQMGLVLTLAIFIRIVIMWLYNGAGRSVLIVALFHSAFNSATGAGDARFTQELMSGPAAQLVPMALLVVVAVALAIFTKGRLAYAPPPSPAQPTARRLSATRYKRCSS